MAGSPDRLVAGRYRLLDTLGRGGMGIVWRARDEYLHREVAVKEILLPSGLDDAARAGLLDRFVREARAAARLDHPGIISVYDVVAEDGLPWIVMRLVRGRSLDQVIRDAGALPPGRVAHIGVRMLDALGAAHAEGILHRDVTPRNVLIGDDGRVVLTDFGIAAIEGGTVLTQTGALLGSPGYIAPERLRGHRPGPESDLWALGATLYFAVEGRPAYSASEIPALIGMVLTGDPAPTRRAGPLTPTLNGLLIKEPADRLTAEQARRRLEPLTHDRPDDATRTKRATARAEGRPVTERKDNEPAGPKSRDGTPADRAEQETVTSGAPATAHPPDNARTEVDEPAKKASSLTAGNVIFGLLIAIGVNVFWNPFHLIGEGKFRSVPVACGGVSAETVNRLVPAGHPIDSCSWADQGGARTLDVLRVSRLKRNAWRSAERVAHDYLKIAGSSGVTTSIGDEARIRAGTSLVTVWFRVSNIVVSLYYSSQGDAQLATAGALLAARQMAGRLEAVS